AGVLATALASDAATAAPVALEASVASGALLGANSASTGLSALVRGTLEAWRLAKLKMAGALCGIGVGLGLAVNAVVPEKQPDPLALLQKIAEARRRIASGEMEIELAVYHFGRPLDGTNHIRLKAVFDGEKHRRFESFGREYS